MLTAAEIIDRANQISKSPHYATQALVGLNAILSDICQDYDFALARGVFNFTFNPSLSTMFGSGPYNLPLDYLRTSGSSGAEGVTRSAWFMYPAPAFPAGQPMPLVPIDLGEFDQYPQLPAQGIPSVMATDMGGPLTQRIVLKTTAQTTSGSVLMTPADSTGLVAGLSIAGEGITPGSTVVSIDSSVPKIVTMSAPATATASAASVFFGIAPVCYIYPAPVGPYPATVRYQRMMPPIIQTTQFPWFPNDGYLIEKLASWQMEITDDSRATEWEQKAGQRMQKYADMADDKTNRAQAVQLDARRYGRGFGQNLRITKAAGW